MACDEMKSRMESQLLGSVVATYVGTSRKSTTDTRLQEAHDLRDLVADSIEKNIQGQASAVLKQGWETHLIVAITLETSVMVCDRKNSWLGRN